MITGHRIPRRRRPPDRQLQDVVGLPLPDHALQRRPAQDHTGRHHLRGRGRQLPARGLDVAVQLSIQHKVRRLRPADPRVPPFADSQIASSDDMYAPDSIELLQKSGLDFQRHEEMGIMPQDFAEVMITSGMVLAPETKWVSFHR